MLIILSSMSAGCDLEKNKLYTYTDVMKCLEIVQINKTTLTKHHDVISELMKHYVFLEEANSAMAERRIDIQKSLLDAYQKHLTLFDTKSTIPVLPYLDDVQEIVRIIGDSHFVYWKPEIFGSFKQVSPVKTLRVNSTWVLGATPYTDMYSYQITNVSKHIGSVITKVNNLSVEDFIQKFGDENAKHKFKNQRFAQALVHDFNEMTLNQQPFRQGEYTFELKNGETFTIQRPVVVNKAISEKELDEQNQIIIRPDPFSQMIGEVTQPTVKDERTTQAVPTHPAFTLLKSANMFALYQHIATGTLFLRLISMNPDPYLSSMSTFLEALEIIAKSPSKLFVNDMNGGGNSDFSALTALTFMPELFPIAERNRFQHSRLFDLLHRVPTSVLQITATDFFNGQKTHTWDYQNTTKENAQWAIPNYSGSSDYFGMTYEDQPDRYTVMLKYLKFKGINKDPNQVIVFTNGICISASGYFAHFLKQNGFGVHVALGKDFEQLCAVPGGHAKASDEIIDAIKGIINNPKLRQNYSEDEISFMKKQWLPIKANVRYTYYKVYASDMAEPLALQLIPKDYRQDVRADIVLDVFPTNNQIDNGFLEFFDLVIQNKSLYDENNYFGKMCNSQNNTIYRNKQGKCIKYGCAYGYRKENEFNGFFCVKRTDRYLMLADEGKPQTPETDSTLIIVLSVVGSILVICIVVAVIAYFMIKKRRNYKQIDHE